MGGEPCFGGTRVQIDTLFAYLRDGNTLDQFLADYPSVKRQVALWVLMVACEMVKATSITVTQ